MEKRDPAETKQVEQEMLPAEEREIGPEAETAKVPEASGSVQVLVSVKSSAVNSPTSELLLKYKLLPVPPLVKASPLETSPTAVMVPPVPVAEMVKVLVELFVASETPDPASMFKVVVADEAVMEVSPVTSIDENKF